MEKLAALVGSMDTNLRLNAVWALKNLLYQAEPDIKQQVTKRLTYGTLLALLSDTELAIQEQALNLLRNLVCGKEQDIQDVFEGMSEGTLMQVLESKLAGTGEDDSDGSGGGSDEVVVQALYTIVNIATGTEAHKSSIMKQDAILKRVLECIVRWSYFCSLYCLHILTIYID